MDAERKTTLALCGAAAVILACFAVIASHGPSVQTQTAPVAEAPPPPTPVPPAPPPAPFVPPAAWTASERLAPIEPDAQLDDYAKAHLDFVDSAVATTREGGYQCDTVSAVIRGAFHPTISLECNDYRYAYELKDDGSGWRATPDD